MVLTKNVADLETGEVLEVPLTAEEIAQRDLDIAAGVALKTAEDLATKSKAALKASAISKLVAGTPLTQDEAKLLVL